MVDPRASGARLTGRSRRGGACDGPQRARAHGSDGSRLEQPAPREALIPRRHVSSVSPAGIVRRATEGGQAMTETRRTDLLGRLADMSEEAIQRVSDAPGGEKLVSAMNALKDRTDELQKRFRGLEDLDKRLSAVETKLDELTKGGGTSDSEASRKSTKATKSSGEAAAKAS
jgi:hypothetical protein